MSHSKNSLFSFLNLLVHWGAVIIGIATAVLFIVKYFTPYPIDEKCADLLFAAFVCLGLAWYVLVGLIQKLKPPVFKILRRGISERYATGNEVEHGP